MDKGSIRTVNARLNHFVELICSTGDQEVDKFVIKKFVAKFERPNSTTAQKRKENAWARWIGKDEILSNWEILGPHWAKARLLVHEWLSGYHIGQLTFTNGSSFVPLGPRTSVACKLTDEWTVTRDCFDLFVDMASKHKAFRHACKKRFKNYCRDHRLDERQVNRTLWKRFGSNQSCLRFKFYCVVKFVNGNRYGTVPKNNQKDRSICLEPLCNMFVQRAIGLGLRNALLKACDVDLDNLAEKHRLLISSKKVATIDLSDCSDAISLKLVRYLLPKRALSHVLASRSEMTLGPDGNYYVTRKVSSMGNGFTFDLMSIILLALSRTFDTDSSVFGDDIICRADVAYDLIDNLKRADYDINLSKTNINTGFRESCGAHFLDGHGYVTCFDMKWLHTDHDLIVALNKVAILAKVYGEPWVKLNQDIRECVPPVLLGASTELQVGSTGKPPSFDLSNFVRYGPPCQVDPTRHQLKAIRRLCRNYQYRGRCSIGLYFFSSVKDAPKRLKSTDWDMFYQNISSSRRLSRIPVQREKASLVVRVGEDLIGPLDAPLASNSV